MSDPKAKTGATALLTAAAVSFAAGTAFGFVVRHRRREKAKELVELPPNSIVEFEAEAMKRMSPLAKIYFGYVDGEGITAKACRSFFQSVRLLPRILAGDLSQVDTSLEIFGSKLALPVFIAPTAFHVLACPEEGGEVATSRGAAVAGAGYCYNWMLSSALCSDVVKEDKKYNNGNGNNGGGVKWLHMYMFEEREMVRRAIESAEATGSFSAIVLTCDHPHTRVQGRMLPHFSTLPFPEGTLDRSFFPNQDSVGGESITLRELISLDGNTTGNVPGGTNSSKLSWDDVKWVKTLSKLPIVVKGVLSVNDALRAVEIGADAIVVSNHGGRQFDGAPPAIEALSPVIAAVGGEIPVFVDTGVRCSTDVIKALCIGATGVLLGRPPLWALACGGSSSLARMLDVLREDIEADMMSLGVRNLSELGPSLIWPPDREKLTSIERACGGL